MTKMTISIPDDLRRRAKSLAALRNEHISDVVRRALEMYVADAGHEYERRRAGLAALEEARSVGVKIVQRHGVAPAGWAAQAVREFREEFGA